MKFGCLSFRQPCGVKTVEMWYGPVLCGPSTLPWLSTSGTGIGRIVTGQKLLEQRLGMSPAQIQALLQDREKVWPRSDRLQVTPCPRCPWPLVLPWVSAGLWSFVSC